MQQTWQTLCIVTGHAVAVPLGRCEVAAAQVTSVLHSFHICDMLKIAQASHVPLISKCPGIGWTRNSCKIDVKMCLFQIKTIWSITWVTHFLDITTSIACTENLYMWYAGYPFHLRMDSNALPLPRLSAVVAHHGSSGTVRCAPIIWTPQRRKSLGESHPIPLLTAN